MDDVEDQGVPWLPSEFADAGERVAFAALHIAESSLPRRRQLLKLVSPPGELLGLVCSLLLFCSVLFCRFFFRLFLGGTVFVSFQIGVLRSSGADAAASFLLIAVVVLGSTPLDEVLCGRRC